MELAHRIFASRVATASLALLVAVAAGVAVLAYVHGYRTSVDESGAPASVLVAKQTIPKGMSVATALARGYVETQTLRRDELGHGAVADPSVLRDEVATRDVLPGEQLTTGDFAGSAGGLASRLTGSERAVAIPLDQAHGLAGQAQTGDRVDVAVAFDGSGASGSPVAKTLLTNVPVLAIVKPSASVSGDGKTDVLLRVSTPQATQLAYAVENGEVWLILRPRVGATAEKNAPVTEQTLVSAAGGK